MSEGTARQMDWKRSSEIRIISQCTVIHNFVYDDNALWRQRVITATRCNRWRQNVRGFRFLPEHVKNTLRIGSCRLEPFFTIVAAFRARTDKQAKILMKLSKRKLQYMWYSYVVHVSFEQYRSIEHHYRSFCTYKNFSQAIENIWVLCKFLANGRRFQIKTIFP